MTPADHALRAPYVLSAREISVRYGARLVLEKLSFDVHPGAWTCIVGPNGCGKSTLLRALAGLIDLDGGVVSLQGRPLTAWSRRTRAQRIAWLAQSSDPSDLCAAECVALGRFAHVGWLGALQATDEAAIRTAMTATGSLSWAGRRLSTLSGGERQRVHLARTLAVQASILLLDEPTTHLDPPHAQDVARLLRDQAQGCGVTIVSAIHDLSLALTADRLLVMGRTGLIGHGSAREAVDGDWLSLAFETPIKIMRSGDAYVWQPHLGAVTRHERD
jgi:iron complex transport system ATP-binding protein